MTASSSEQSQTMSSSTADTSAEPSTSESSQSQQAPAKQNRKQRRKTQQQQQQQQQSTASQLGKLEKQDMELPNQNASKTMTETSTQDKSDTTSKNTASESQPTLSTPSQLPNDKTRTTKPSDPSNQQPSSKPLGTPGLAGTNPKRAGAALMQPPTPGVPTPLRTPISHPLLQQQLMQQYHLQLRMAQGGLLQSPLTPQQFALFQQIARLRMVQQGLAQQQLNQKHSQHNSQQLYQQQQQVALMLAQLQQQLVPQQSAGNRFPSPPFPAAGQPPTTAGNQQQQATQKPGGKPGVTDKTNEAQPSTSEGGITEVSQAKEVTPVTGPVSSVSLEERGKETSPAPQSRLTQWKQPLLPDPDQTGLSNDIQGNQWSSGGLRSEPNPNISPKITRESISSRWGVDAAPKLSADPPEFKPGVPWRPRKEGEVSPKSESVSPSPSPVSPAKQTSKSSGFTDTSMNSPSQYSFGIGSSPWQSTGPADSLLTKPPSSSIRPPPGLNSHSTSTETTNLEDEHSWVNDLVDTVPAPRFGHNGPKNDFKFGHLGFPMAGAAWSTQDGQPFTAPDPKPWAAPGGPSPIASSAAVPKETSVGPVSGSNPSAEISKSPNMGISSWSVNQPIPSAEEKLSHPSVTSESGPMMRSDTGSTGSKSGSASLSTWLVLRNIPQRVSNSYVFCFFFTLF